MANEIEDRQRPAPATDDVSAEQAADTTHGASGTGAKGPKQPPGEIGGREGPEPTRYGDWEVGGRCTDF